MAGSGHGQKNQSSSAGSQMGFDRKTMDNDNTQRRPAMLDRRTLVMHERRCRALDREKIFVENIENVEGKRWSL